ncbi:serine hydrolase [Limibacter armeniacum]|uniref:serine hydrolase domain-containing protein n=1 Tax=Limibacter armeniacum TaxID=466084 RepID=UPI002FE64E37
MSIKALTFFALACIFSFTACQPKNQGTVDFSDPELSGKIESLADSIFSEKALFGDFIFAVVNENGLVYSFALNLDIQAGKPTTLNNNSPIYIASHTKSFTGTMMKILEEQNKLSLDSSLAFYIPELVFDNRMDTKNINVKALLNHTHGTFSTRLTWKTAFLGYQGENDELINDFNKDFQLDTSHVFRYSNVGPIVSSMIVDRTCERSWKDVMKREIFDPLEMTNTSAYVTDFAFDQIRPSVLGTTELGIVEEDFYKTDVTMHASGGVISTVNDLSRWLSANIRQDDKLMKKSSWADLHQSTTAQDRRYFTYHRSGYSLGWDIAEYQNKRILTRFGGLAGISFHISFMPEHQIGIIALSTDNRASLLPHLIANYAYNHINNQNADSIFQIEYSKFDEYFEKVNNEQYPKQEGLLKKDDSNKLIAGIYQNSLDWPDIKISQEQDHYQFEWGVLNGKVYRKDEHQYLASLGVLIRNFEVRNDTLLTGSLIYLKKD